MRRADNLRRDRQGGPKVVLALWVSQVVLLSAPCVTGQEASDHLSLATELRNAATRALPCVVTVSGTSPGGRILPEGLPPVVSSGSGVVINADRGLILTANSVVQEVIDLSDPPLRVTLPDGRSRPVLDFRQDPASDLALIAIDPTGLELQALNWGRSEALGPGELVLSLGHPWGFSGSVSLGIVSGLHRSLAPSGPRDLIQTDALIAPGSAGGALVNAQGELVGILLFVPGVSDRFDRVGFAVPSDRAQQIAQDLIDWGQVRRMVLGVQVSTVEPELVAMLETRGAVRVEHVADPGPAHRSGLRPGDLILSVNGRPITTPSDLISLVEFASADQPVTLEMLREGQAVSIEVQPEPMLALPGQGAGPMIVGPPPVEPAPPDIDDPTPPIRLPEPTTSRDPARFPSLGLRLGEPSPALTNRFGLEPTSSGVIIVGITPGGPADLGGLEPGMVITDVLDRRIQSLADFRESVANVPPDRDLILRIQHRGRSEFRVILRKPSTEPNYEFDPSASCR